MISRRILINLGVFVAVSTALISYGLVSLLGNPLRPPTTLYAVFPSAAGMRTHFSVTLNGVDVGSVSSVRLERYGVRVGMAINPGVRIPADVNARIDWANALGEQQVELETPGNATPLLAARSGYLASDATVPVAADGTPVQVGQVVAIADHLLSSIPVGDLNSFLEQLSTALDGNATNLRTIIESSNTLSEEFLRYQKQFIALLDYAPPLLNGVASVGPQLTQALENTAVLTHLIADRRYDLVALMNDGANASQVADQLIATEEPNLACMLHDFSGVTANLAQSANLANLDVGLATNQWFFGAIDKVVPTGPTISLYQGDKASSNQEWIRTHLLIPPAQPAADPYVTPVGIPATRPGAGCATAEFGNGVGAATQATPQNPVPGSSIAVPSPADAHVSGGG